MGCCFSSSSPSNPLECVRVVHINGYVEDFPEPVTVSQVIGKPAKLFLCSSAQLLSFHHNSQSRLGLDDLLQPGRLYFLLPHSIFQSDSSPLDLAALVTRLTAIANNSRAPSNNAAAGISCGSPAKPEPGSFACGGRMSCRARSWKPILDTIEEKSFGRSMRDLSTSVSMEHQELVPKFDRDNSC